MMMMPEMDYDIPSDPDLFQGEPPMGIRILPLVRRQTV